MKTSKRISRQTKKGYERKEKKGGEKRKKAKQSNYLPQRTNLGGGGGGKSTVEAVMSNINFLRTKEHKKHSIRK